MRRPAHAVEVGRRVVLRAPVPGDRRQFVVLMRGSRRFLHPWVSPPTFAALMRRTRRPTERVYFVCRRDDGAIVGVINVSQIYLGNFRSAYLGVYAGARHAGRGLMREGVALALRHAFRRLGLHRLEANIQPANRRSIRFFRGLGFRREGLSPRYLRILGRWRDHARWAITTEDLR